MQSSFRAVALVVVLAGMSFACSKPDERRAEPASAPPPAVNATPVPVDSSAQNKAAAGGLAPGPAQPGAAATDETPGAPSGRPGLKGRSAKRAAAASGSAEPAPPPPAPPATVADVSAPPPEEGYLPQKTTKPKPKPMGDDRPWE